MSKISVLVVEDQQLIASALARALEDDEELQLVYWASDGRIAVQKVAELTPDVVVMDIGLPELDGIECTKQIKEAYPKAKVLMFTANYDDASVFGALTAGADGYCLKGSGVKKLLSAVKAVAEGAAWLDATIARKVLTSVRRPEQKFAAKYGLSPREVEVLSLIVRGDSNKEIANTLQISIETTKTHVRHIFEKLVVADRTEAALKALHESF